jgi:preprotein translocase subunit SecF
MKRRLPSNETLIRVACVMALTALPMMVWSVFSPTVWPVLVALSVGQAIGTLSFVLFLVVVARDLGVKRKLRPEG